MRDIKYFFLCGLVAFSTSMFGQKSLKKQAEVLYKNANYFEVMKSLEQYKSLDADPELLSILADSYRKVNSQSKAIGKYQILLESRPEIVENFYKLAQCYDELGKYDEALKFYKRYLAEELDKKYYLYPEAIKSIKRIGQSRKIKFQPQIAFVENAGAGVNSLFDENKIVQSRHIQTRFYFSSNRAEALGGLKDKDGKKEAFGGSANSDIFVFETNNGTIVSDDITSQFNTEKSEVIEEINADGNAIIYQSNQAVLIDTFNVDGGRMTSEFTSPFNPNRGDRDLKMYNDSTLIFSSKYYSGYGGYDVFVCKRNDSGTWGEPINLGNKINTTYNEVSPFLTRGGNTLFFSSDRINSIGGYDIYAVQYTSAGWGREVNLGIPVNSTRDDLAGIITNDGAQLYFCSNRIGSTGGYDIYIAYLKEQINDQLMYSEMLPMLAQSSDNIAATIESGGEDLLKVETFKNKERTYINQIMYYKDDVDVLSISNINSLKNLKSMYDIYPDLKVSIIAHSGMDNEKSLALFFGLKRTESLKEELVKMGMKESALAQCSYGVSFPGTYEKTRYNSRIEFVLSGAEKNNLKVINEEINLNADVKHLAYDDYNKNKGGLIFKIKVAESYQMLRSNEILALPKMSVHREKGLYEYYTGYTSTYNDAMILFQDLQSKGFSQVEIVPFASHIKVSKEAAETLSTQYPELNQFLGK
jgi:tetratricopeptide (TPR) repeat protein